jgi:P27 family predicted phage terminase small subunit
MPKPADKVQGHRARPVVKDPVVQAPEVQRTPDPKADWLDSTKTAWAVYWRSDVARIVLDVDAPSIFRLFSLYDQHERSMDVVRMALVVKGSTGQIRTNPLADHALKLEGVILRLENELGLTPLARSRLGIQIARVPTTEGMAQAPSPYGHLRAVND